MEIGNKEYQCATADWHYVFGANGGTPVGSAGNTFCWLVRINSSCGCAAVATPWDAPAAAAPPNTSTCKASKRASASFLAVRGQALAAAAAVLAAAAEAVVAVAAAVVAVETEPATEAQLVAEGASGAFVLGPAPCTIPQQRRRRRRPLRPTMCRPRPGP